MHKWALIILFFVLLIMPLNNEEKRRRRNIETDEQRDARLEEQRNRMAVQRLNETVEQREGKKISCLEEIAYKYQYIDKNKLKKIIQEYSNAYGEYLKKLI